MNLLASASTCINTHTQQDAAPTLPLRAQGHQPPLFLLHDLAGSGLSYMALSRLIDADRPVHALTLPDSAHSGTPAFSSLAQLAALHAQTIQRVQPHGPYHLAGWSAGGVLAYATAARLMERGEQVAYLGLIDAPCPARATTGSPTTMSAEAPTATPHTPREVLLAYLASTTDLEDPQRRAQLQRWADTRITPTIEHIVDEARQAGLLPTHLDIGAIRPLLAQASALAHAIQHEALPPLALSAPLHYYAASSGVPEQVQQWREALPGQLTVHPIEADHWSILRAPAVDQLALHMNQALKPEAATSAPASSTSATPASAPTLKESGASPVVVIQAGAASESPVVCIPGAGAHVTCFVPLTQALGPRVPVLGMQPRGLDGKGDPFPTVEDAAAHHVQALLALGLAHPVTLVGHSFGGWIAFEMARQLRELGQPVHALVLLDSRPPSAKGAAGRQFDRLDAIVELARLLAQQAEQAGHPLKLHRADLAALHDDAQIAALHRAMVQARLLAASSQAKSVADLVRVFHANLNTRYMPLAELDVDTLIVCAKDTPPNPAHAGGQDRATPWQPFTPRARIHTISGNHMTMLQQPHIDIVAARLRQPHATEPARGQGHCAPSASAISLQSSQT